MLELKFLSYPRGALMEFFLPSRRLSLLLKPKL
jgi:hypothetical protein